VPEAPGVEPGTRNPVVRTLDLLLWMAGETPPWSIRPASRALGTSPTSIHRLISVLETRGLVWRDDEGRYYPGHELIRMSEAFSRKLSVKQLARPHLEQLANATGESSLLAQFDLQRPAMTFVDMIRSSHPITYITTLYDWKPLHAGASGLVILAHLSEAELTRFFDIASLTQLTPSTMVTPAGIKQEIKAILERGYGITRGQRTPGAVGMAVPIFDARDHVVGSLCLTIPNQRFDPSIEKELAAVLISKADAISDELTQAGLAGRSGLPSESRDEV
jgi:DNA-binding IclR family transcriptional regulator